MLIILRTESSKMQNMILNAERTFIVLLLLERQKEFMLII